MTNHNQSVPMVTDSVQRSRNRIWSTEVMGNSSNVRFTSPTLSHQPVSYNWPKVVPQPPEEPFVLYVPDFPPSQNPTTNHHIPMNSTTGDMDFENLCLFTDIKISQISKIQISLNMEEMETLVHMLRFSAINWVHMERMSI
ncbi:hypothetical protein ACH5RR_006750 [Cinchona calisaya]|uniref:Uncharacterized protein n=1 Tax=Cinchona calisaya TaxID=153742 RepID=A0ABD3APY6_9GENT